MNVAQALENTKPSYIREILKAAKSPDVISLAGGLPAQEMIPADLFSKALNDTVNTNKPAFNGLLQYGETQGYDPLISTIRTHYNIDHALDVIITNGAQQGLDLIARAFIDKGDHVVVEAPSYLGALQIFNLAQAQITSVRQVDGGPDLAELKTLFSKHTVKCFYAEPDFHNPTGSCWPLNIRLQVADLCLRYGVTLIEDAPYRELRFSGDPLPLASSFCKDNAILLRSFSKIIAPGIRLGAAIAPQHLITPLIRIKQAADLHTATPLQAALKKVLEDQIFPNYLNNLRNNYLTRYTRFKQILSKLNKYGCQCDEIEGGMFVWLKLPSLNSYQLAESLLAKGIAVVPDRVFYANSESTQPAFRLNFTYEKIESLDIAIQKIEQALSHKKF